MAAFTITAEMFEVRERRRPPSVADIVPTLARQFLAEHELGSRLPTVRALAREHRSSNSSVHAAIGRLEQGGAIAIETRGRAGAFLVDRSIDRLWAMMKTGPLVIALPLASSPRYEALATAIKQLITNAGLEVILMFVRGSRQRLQAVREGRCHLAAMSSFAASELRDAGEAVVMELLPNSYNTGHRVFYTANGENAQPVRVVVDRHSADQQLLTALEFVDRELVTPPAMTGRSRGCWRAARRTPPCGRSTRCKRGGRRASSTDLCRRSARAHRGSRHSRGARGASPSTRRCCGPCAHASTPRRSSAFNWTCWRGEPSPSTDSGLAVGVSAAEVARQLVELAQHAGLELDVGGCERVVELVWTAGADDRAVMAGLSITHVTASVAS